MQGILRAPGAVAARRHPFGSIRGPALRAARRERPRQERGERGGACRRG
jgi:hypothetical protein